MISAPPPPKKKPFLFLLLRHGVFIPEVKALQKLAQKQAFKFGSDNRLFLDGHLH
jgi:hypothetical protein